MDTGQIARAKADLAEPRAKLAGLRDKQREAEGARLQLLAVEYPDLVEAKRALERVESWDARIVDQKRIVDRLEEAVKMLERRRAGLLKQREGPQAENGRFR